MYKFELSENEIATYEKWFKEEVLDENKIYPVQFEFTQTGIGVCIKVSCGYQIKDITDYDSW